METTRDVRRGRVTLFKAVCLVLVAYGIFSIIGLGAAGRTGGLGAATYGLFAGAHILLVIVAGIRFINPMGMVGYGRVLLALAVALAVLATTLLPAPTGRVLIRIAFLAAAYLGARMTAPRPRS